MVEQTQTVADRLDDDVLDKLEGAENAVNPIDQIKKRINQDDTTRGFSISRIPTDAHEDFKTLAQNMFADDYGMALAFLVHYFKMNDKHNKVVQELSDEIHNRLDQLEDSIEEKDGADNGSKVSTIQ